MTTHHQDADPSAAIDTPAGVAAYLSAALDKGDTSEFVHALGVVVRARGMTEIAKAAGLSRESLYKALRPDASPRFDTVARVCAALGVRLVAQPVHG